MINGQRTQVYGKRGRCVVQTSNLCQLSVVALHVLPERWDWEYWPHEVGTVVGHVYMLAWHSRLGGYCALALNRYVAVMHPTKLHAWFTCVRVGGDRDVRRVRRCAWTLAVVWASSVVLAMAPLLGVCCLNVIRDHDDEASDDGHHAAETHECTC